MKEIDTIKQFLENKAKTLNLADNITFEVNLEIPKNLNNADYALNTAMIYAKNFSMTPLDLANEIVENLNKYLESNITENNTSIYDANNFDKVTVASPGFINIFLSKKYIRENIKLNLQKEYIQTKFTDKNILVEHSSPNLFKPFHIGHLMNNFIGEFIVRATKISSAHVTTMSYPSDISLGIAKAMYIIMQGGNIDEKIATSSQEDIVTYLSEAYVQGVNLYKKAEQENDLNIISEIKKISNNLYNNIESPELYNYTLTKKINLNYLYKSLEELGSHFDKFVFESESSIQGKKIILENTGEIDESKTFKKSEGAVVYIPDEGVKDINTTVFINSEGNPTYAAKDIGLLRIKFKENNPDYSFFVTDSEQIPHFKVVLIASKNIDEDFVRYAQKSHHIPHGRMTLKGQKMSSRLGSVPTAEEIISLVLNEVIKKSSDKLDDLDEVEKIKVQKDIALAALRIVVLRAKPGVNIDFDPERATSFEGDSGPYLCYTHARCISLLEKGSIQSLLATVNEDIEVTNLERKLFQFEKIIIESIESIAPQKLVTYLFELSQEFNSFYATTQIISNDKKLSEHSLYIVNQVKIVLQKSLYILGINAPDKM